MRNRWRAALFGALALIWLAVLFMLSGMDGNSSGSLSLWVTRHFFMWLRAFGLNLSRAHHLVRKLAHFIVFAVEGFLIWMTLASLLPRRWSALLCAMACALLAVANELHQTTAAGRVCDIRDMLIDTAGGLAGLTLTALITALIHHRRSLTDAERRHARSTNDTRGEES